MNAASVRTLLCPNCGAPIHHGDLECEFCGAALYAGRAAEVTVPALAEAQAIIPEMRRRIKENAYDGDAYYQLGLACFTLKLYDQAESAFEQAQRFSPGSALVHYFSGLSMLRGSEAEILSIQQFRIRQMQKEFEEASSVDPNFVEAKMYGRFVEGLLARNREDYASAIDPLRSTVEALPGFGLAWQVLAACYFQTGDYRAAIQAGTRAVRLLPDNADAAYLVGAAHARLDDLEETENWARRIAEMRGKPQSWTDVARELRGQGV